jgi:hypothetical protein
MTGVGCCAALEAVGDDRSDARIECGFGDDGFDAGRDADRDADQPDAVYAMAGKVGNSTVHVGGPTASRMRSRVLRSRRVPRASQTSTPQPALCQRSGMADRSLAVTAGAVHEHNRRTVARAHIPAGEADAVPRKEVDALVRASPEQPARSPTEAWPDNRPR